MLDLRTMHVGRSWSGTRLEDGCSCGKAACGLVDMAQIDEGCKQHGVPAMKTMRQMHAPETCPALPSSVPEPEQPK